MKKVLIFFVFISLSTAVKSNPKIVMDSIGLEQKNDRIYVLHKIESGETLYTLAKRYRADIDVLISSNPGIDKDNLRVGQLIRVPSQTAQVVVSTMPTVKMQVITHEVKSGETLWGIAKEYNVEESEIKRLNNLPSNTLYAKQSLLIEVPMRQNIVNPNNPNMSATGVKEIGKDGEESFWWAFQPIADSNTKMVQLVHLVEFGETLQKIGQFHNVSVPKLMEWNAKENTVVKTGERLIVGYEYVDESGRKIIFDNNGNPKPTDSKENVEEKLKERIRTGIPVNRRMTVMGVMIEGNSFTTTSKHLALHRSAKEGSYIKVTNPNNGKSTFVRVLGNIQNVDVDKDVGIKLSKAACQAIGIVDAKFPVDLEYND